MQEIFLQPGCREAVTPGAGECRDKCLGEGKGENAPRFPISESQLEGKLETRETGLQGPYTTGRSHPPAPECGGWTALDTSTMMSCSQLTSGQRWSLTRLPGRTESQSTGAHHAHHGSNQRLSPHHPPCLPWENFGLLATAKSRGAMQPSAQTLPILRQASCIQTSPSERQHSVVRARCQRYALLPASSAEKTLESTCLLTDSCSLGLVF